MTFPANSINAAERIESLKAGLTGAIATIPVLLLMQFITPLLAAPIAETVNLSEFWLGSAEWLKGAIVLLSGFLFGATYRYVIRQDANPHLRSGAVMAFGLVRGLAQLEVSLNHTAPLLLSIRVFESVLLFAVAALVLDWAFQQGWIKTFRAGNG